MNSKPHLVRGAVLKCLFPFEEDPSSPGPSPHYCLFIESLVFEAHTYIVVAYGTSKLDFALQSKHPILDVPTKLLNGESIPSAHGVIHFLCDHVAVIPFTSDWVYMNFSARLGIFKKEYLTDPHRRTLLAKYEKAEPVMLRSSISETARFMISKLPGITPGFTLR